MGRRLDLTGQRFGKLKAIKDVGKSSDGRRLWLCKCDCGREHITTGKLLKDGHTKSCGCLKEAPASNRNDLTGKRFGRLTVLSYSHTKNKRAYWNCLCDCGNEIIAMGKYLVHGDTKSCGCLKPDILFERNYKHDMSNTRFYYIWAGMKHRCNNKNEIGYKNYGGRGITYQPSWEDFQNFYEDMYLSYCKHAEQFGENNTSIDRINNNGNYTKENCHWATRVEQANNTRQNRVVAGTNMTATQYARNIGKHPATIIQWLNNGKLQEETRSD